MTMMKNLWFYRDHRGCPRVNAPERHRLLSTFLETDIQGDIAVGRELLFKIEKVLDNTGKSEEFTGNAHTVFMSGGNAVISSLFDPESDKETLELDLLRKAVSQWLGFL